MAILRVGHIGVCVSDLEKARAFYCDRLGFRALTRVHVADETSARLLRLREVDQRTLFVERDGVRLALFAYEKPETLGDVEPREMNRRGLAAIMLRVDDLDATLAELRAHGARVLEETLVEHADYGSKLGFVVDPDGTLIELSNAELLESDCDILIPAAIENQITAGNAAAIKASVIVELANGPTAPDADPILADAGKIVVPDVLANSGGVTVSYFEWVQNKSGFYWSEDEIHRRLKDIIEPEAEKIWALAHEKNFDLRTAAYVHALGRIAAAVEARGTQEYFRPGGD